jgi:hypothetical protein
VVVYNFPADGLSLQMAEDSVGHHGSLCGHSLWYVVNMIYIKVAAVLILGIFTLFFLSFFFFFFFFFFFSSLCLMLEGG